MDEFLGSKWTNDRYCLFLLPKKDSYTYCISTAEIRYIDLMILFGVYLWMEVEKINTSLEFPDNIRHPSNLMSEGKKAVLKALRIHTYVEIESNFQKEEVN